MNKIACFGDSLTKGVPGTTYLKFLNIKQFKNYGVGGDTLLAMTKRLAKRNKKHDFYIIGIGTNDILLPFFEDYSQSWNLAIKIKKRKNTIPLIDINEFKNNYEKMLKMLKNKKVMVIGIPYFESAYQILNKKADEYNNIIKKVCEEHDIPYIDIKKSQTRYHDLGEYETPKNWLEVPHDVVVTRKQKNIDELSEKRGLKLTIDGIHFNTRSARMLAQLIDEKIESM